MTLFSPLCRIMAACWLAMALFLTGCARFLPVPDATSVDHKLNGFILNGRFSLTQFAHMQAEQRHSGRLYWKYESATASTPGASASSEILLSSPLGQGIAEIVQDAQGARLSTAEGKTFTAPDAETLTQEVLGYALPLLRLADWIRARPARSDAGETRRDESGRLTHLRLDGWMIDYEYADTNPQSLPRRIHAQRPEEFELRLIVDTWQPLPAEAGTP
ncbi:lipoprotein insertase outer membrane protein LolB [Dentiradicibacter hellwigii]|uniref:Outer-membrane lipoprotein LolB n=1 Tax=Dentiradicibacter hellwigii TaxID=3149053 RepID=A0ABV4UCJ2_9RHOO